MFHTQNTLSGSQEVAICIGLFPCGGTACSNIDVQEVLGNVLYNGPYKPELVEPGKPPYQNFTVTVPQHFESQELSLSVAHFALIGVSDIGIAHAGRVF